MKKAIFGGSFDPPHLGHLEVIKEALKTLDIDELIIMPAYLNPFKSKFYASAKLRLKWLKKMTKEFKNVRVSSFEVDKNRPVSSIESVRHIKNIKDDIIYFIIGADNLKDLKKWNSFDELDSMLTWVVAYRDNIKVPDNFIQLKVDINISATQLRENMQQKYLENSTAKEITAFYKGKKWKNV